MADLYKQVFVRSYADNPRREQDFSLFESVGEYYEKNVELAKGYFSRYQTAKDRINFYKSKVMGDLANYLIDFEINISRQGVKVIYAEDKESALAEINKILTGGQYGIFLSNNEVLQEINIKPFLKQNNYSFFQSDMQKMQYPVLTDIKDKVLSDLKDAYTSPDFKPEKEEVMNFYRKHLINNLYSGSVAITGADFLISDMGGVVLEDNNGLNSLYVSFAKKHIVVAGIDQMIPSYSDLDYFSSMWSGTVLGKMQVWNELVLTGTRRSSEIDGPEEMYVILLDNGRTQMLTVEQPRKIFNCIHCGACAGLCPVFKYTNRLDNPPLKGPKNVVVDPVISGYGDFGYMSFACTLCGKCSEVCPSKINLHELVLYNRKEGVERDKAFGIQRSEMKLLHKMLMKEKHLLTGRFRFKMRMKFKKKFGSQKEFPNFKQKSFRVLWKEAQEKKNN